MSPTLIAALAALVFATSAISGMFGMAGGMILMTALLLLMPVPAAMAIHATIQIASNGWRCALWRRHIVWRALPFYGLGVAMGFSLVAAITYVPEKPVALIVMGILPLIALALRGHLNLSITNRYHACGAAALLTFIQMTTGVVGPLLDVLYNNAPLTRQQIIATKAFTQTAMHMLRLAYYGLLLPFAAEGISWPDGVGLKSMALFVACSVMGTTAAAFVLQHKMDDTKFKSISRWLMVGVGLACLGQGVYMLLPLQN